MKFGVKVLCMFSDKFSGLVCCIFCVMLVVF